MDALKTPEPCRMMEGRTLRRKLLGQVAEAVVGLGKKGILPALHVVLVGEDKASRIYVNAKLRTAKEVGLDASFHQLPEDVSQEELEKLLTTLSEDDAAHGILLQLPLPKGLDKNRALRCITPAKDVDGLTPENIGNLTLCEKESPRPCTPLGIMRLLTSYGVEIKGKRAVVLGRSQLVGRPLAEMLSQADATVTACHKFTPDISVHTKQADLLFVATGNPALVTGDMLKPGAVVVDVGINRLKNNDVVGDCDEHTCRQAASLLTPVPGGVGPMTVTTLMTNTIDACCRQHGLDVPAWRV